MPFLKKGGFILRYEVFFHTCTSLGSICPSFGSICPSLGSWTKCPFTVTRKYFFKTILKRTLQNNLEKMFPSTTDTVTWLKEAKNLHSFNSVIHLSRRWWWSLSIYLSISRVMSLPLYRGWWCSPILCRLYIEWHSVFIGHTGIFASQVSTIMMATVVGRWLYHSLNYQYLEDIS